MVGHQGELGTSPPPTDGPKRGVSEAMFHRDRAYSVPSTTEPTRPVHPSADEHRDCEGSRRPRPTARFSSSLPFQPTDRQQLEGLLTGFPGCNDRTDTSRAEEEKNQPLVRPKTIFPPRKTSGSSGTNGTRAGTIQPGTRHEAYCSDTATHRPLGRRGVRRVVRGYLYHAREIKLPPLTTQGDFEMK